MVHPQWQRRGIGRRIMYALLKEGRTRNLTSATHDDGPVRAVQRAVLYVAWLPHPSGTGASRAAVGAPCGGEAAGLDPRRRVAMQLVF